jgi:lipid A ethanolaminephosphotransferase
MTSQTSSREVLSRVLTPSRVIWLFAAVNLMVFQVPLLRYVNAHVELKGSLGLGVVAILVMISLMLMWLVLGLSSLVSVRLLKPLIAFFSLGNGLALYAMNNYQVILDRAMMGNVFNTNSVEAAGFLHPSLLVYGALAGLLPGWLLWKLRLAPEGRLRRSAHLAGVWVIGVGLIFSLSGSWLWIDQNAKVLGGLMLPWSYTVNSARHFVERHNANRQLELLPPIEWVSGAEGIEPVTVVLVIGESARAGNFSLYGYERDTNPKLKARQVLALPNAVSCSTYTTRSLECILSHDPEAGSLSHEVLPSYLGRSGHVDVVWRSRNWGEPPLKDVKILNFEALGPLCVAPLCRFAEQDEALVGSLDQELAQAGHARQLIVLHQAGSHGPAYHGKYPAGFARFTPACDSVDLKTCSQESLINAYDNTVAYTDEVLDRAISVLEGQSRRRSVLIYLSDHGESLGEGGWYLHGAPAALAPAVQRSIPFLVWMSPAFARDFRVKPAHLDAAAVKNAESSGAPAARTNGQGLVFHTVLGALGVRGGAYRPELDLFEPVQGAH